MTMNANNLATEIWTALLQSGSASSEVQSFASGIVDELTISGSAAFGGTPSGHSISGMTGASLADRINDSYGDMTSVQLLNYATAIVNYIQANAIVTYTGPVPPASPDYFLGGTISGLVGSAMAAVITSSVGYPFTSSELIAKCDAIVAHILTNAQVDTGVIS